MASIREIDQALVHAFQNGDITAFEKLMSKYKPRLSRIVCRMVRDKGDAEDVVQDAFVNAYCGLPKFRGDSAFYTWLFRIAVNTAKNQLLARQRAANVSQPTVEEMAEWTDDPQNVDSDTPMSILENKQLMAALARVMGKIAPDFSVPILLFEVEGMTYSEIAAIVGCPVGTIRSRISRGRSLIAAKLALQGFSGPRSQ